MLVDHLLEVAAEGHRALVFSQFTSFLRRVRDRLDLEGLAASYLDGSSRRRGEIIDGFRKGDDPVFLISLKAGGVGLTLTEADYVFVLDPWWNPAVEAQAVDRTHRIGQQRQVFVYRLVATDTIEEKVMALKARKAALFAQVVDDDALMSARSAPTTSASSSTRSASFSAFFDDSADPAHLVAAAPPTRRILCPEACRPGVSCVARPRRVALQLSRFPPRPLLRGSLDRLTCHEMRSSPNDPGSSEELPVSQPLAVARRAARPVVILVAVLSAIAASALAYADGVDVSHWQGSITGRG